MIGKQFGNKILFYQTAPYLSVVFRATRYICYNPMKPCALKCAPEALFDVEYCSRLFRLLENNLEQKSNRSEAQRRRHEKGKGNGGHPVYRGSVRKASARASSGNIEYTVCDHLMRSRTYWSKGNQTCEVV